MLKNKSLILISCLLLSSCNFNTTIDSNNNLDINNTVSTLNNSVSIENKVEISKLKEYLSVLSGEAPLTSSNLIPERGTTEGRKLTREYITSKLREFGYKVEKHSYRNNGENIFVRLLAEEPTDEYVLAGAHMDSVKNSGANDNGSGSTAILEVARVLKELKGRKVNVLLAWFDEEELGLIGSHAMADDFKKNKMNISSVHTIDMIGWDSDKDKVIEIERPDGDLWDYYLMVNKRHNLNLKLARTNSGSTDHVAFRAKGFKSVGLCEEWAGGDTTPHYHRKTDKFDTIDFEYLEAGTKLLTAVLTDLSLKVDPPRNIKVLPHEMFPGRDRHFHQMIDE